MIALDLAQYYRGGEVGESQFTWEMQGDSQLQIEIQEGVLMARLPDPTWHGRDVVLLEPCDPTGECARTEF